MKFSLRQSARIDLLPLLGLVLFPLVLYWGGIAQRYGFRDDYSQLREAHEQPAKIVRFCTADARPVYGLLLVESFSHLPGVDALPLARGLTALLVGLVCAGTALVLERQLQWPRGEAWLFAAMVAVLPSVQVVVHWAICGPHVFATLLGLAAFALVEWRATVAGHWRATGCLLGGWGLLVLGVLTYQSNALYYVVPVAAGFLAPSRPADTARIRWLAAHLALAAAALLGAFLCAKALFAMDQFDASRRIAFETAWLKKLVWAWKGPGENAFALFVLCDDTGRTEPWHHLAAGLVAGTLLLGGFLEWRRRGAWAAVGWWGAFAACAVLSLAVSLIAAERWPAYRTTLALSGVVGVYFVRSLAALDAAWPQARGRAVGWGLGLLVAVGAGLAVHHTRVHLAGSQAQELRRFEEATPPIDPSQPTRVYAWLPKPEDAPSTLRFLDEFGSLSADCEWCAKEMLYHLLHMRHPAVANPERLVKFSARAAAPAPGSYDVLIDLRVKP